MLFMLTLGVTSTQVLKAGAICFASFVFLMFLCFLCLLRFYVFFNVFVFFCVFFCFVLFVLLYFVIWLDSPYELPCKIWSLQLKKWLYFCTFLYFCNLFKWLRGSRSTCMQNFGLLAQKLSELCSILFSVPCLSPMPCLCQRWAILSVSVSVTDTLASNTKYRYRYR